VQKDRKSAADRCERTEVLVVYIDISVFVARRYNTGIQRVVREIVMRLIYGEYETVVLVYSQKRKRFEEVAHREVLGFFGDVGGYEIVSKPIDLFAKSKKKRVFFEIDSVWNGAVARGELYRKLQRSGYKIVSFVYDLIGVLYPQWMRKETARNFPGYIESVALYSDMVLFDSKSAKSDFVAHTKERKVGQKLEVVGLGCSLGRTSQKPAARYQKILSGRYILFVGTIEPRKGHACVLDAYERLKREFDGLELVFVGKHGWGMDGFIKRLCGHRLLGKKVHWLSDLSDGVLAHFYQNAFVVTYISRYEGFGLPVAEALGFSNIVISCNNSSLAESSQNLALYVNKKDIVGSIVEYVRGYMNDASLYREHREYIEAHFRPKSWQEVYLQISYKLFGL